MKVRPNGADCGQRHLIACPEFDRTGACSKDTKCPTRISIVPTDKDEDDRPKLSGAREAEA